MAPAPPSEEGIPRCLHAPFTSCRINEVRTGKMALMPNLTISSGINKVPVSPGSRAQVTTLGLEGDEHDPTFHGGVDKAVHGYCSQHYAYWRSKHPSAASRLVPGGFGENFVLHEMNERNVCIGDVFEVRQPEADQESEMREPPVQLQISLPRQPCFKLNHRFSLKNFAPETYATSRTGFYFRVLRPGTVAPGDTITLIARPHPTWTVERVQEYLHRTTDDEAANAELAGIKELGDESRKIFARRTAKAERARRKREAGEEQEGGAKERWREYEVVEKKAQTSGGRITSFVLKATEPDPEGTESLGPGAHARVKLPNGLVRAYSIVSGSRARFELGVALADNSRGGSACLHNEVSVGSRLEVGRMTGSVTPGTMASKHVFLAGGVGITAFLALMEDMLSIHFDFVCHYGVRRREDVPFRERLEGLGDRVVLYPKDEGKRMNITEIMGCLPWNSYMYVCGPNRLMEEVQAVSKEKGLGEDDIHYEAFAADTGGDPFDVEVVNKGNKRVHVGEEDTLLEVLRREFGDIPSSCEAGNCGTCKVALKSGRVHHRGTGLPEGMKEEFMLSCVSRGVGKIVIEI